jgi:hypothetical protein
LSPSAQATSAAAAFTVLGFFYLDLDADLKVFESVLKLMALGSIND